MITPESQQISLLLSDWSNGDDLAIEKLMPLVYDELRRMAKNFMRLQPTGHTFQTTELIHEAYLKLAAGAKPNWQNRSHFFGVASQAMRHILVDYARSKNSKKRGGMADKITLDDNLVISNNSSSEILALDETLIRFAALDKRKASVVEMKFFAVSAPKRSQRF